MVGHYSDDEPQAQDTDSWALDHGYVTITPTTADLTAYEAMNVLSPLASLSTPIGTTEEGVSLKS